MPTYPYDKQRSVTETSFADGEVTVYEDDGTTKATIYADKYELATKSNPVTIDGSGAYSYFVPPGIYVEELTKGEVTIKRGVSIRPDNGWLTEPSREEEWAKKSFSLIRTKRVEQSISGASTEEVVVTWDTAFPDTNYTTTAEIKSGAGSLGDSLRLMRITAQDAASITVSVKNDNVSALTGTVHAIAIHDEALS